MIPCRVCRDPFDPDAGESDLYCDPCLEAGHEEGRADTDLARLEAVAEGRKPLPRAWDGVLAEARGKVIRYTTAPEAYDYGYTRTVDPDAGFDGTKGVRQVEIPQDSVLYQEGRYGSGMYVSLTQAEYDKWVAAGHIRKTN